MMLGPINILKRKPNPVHSALRRDVGICAGVTAIGHTILGLQVHMGGVLSRYFVAASGARGAMAFVATNYLGLVSAALLVVLVLISNNKAIVRLGLERWKRIQRLAYFAVAIAIIHGFMYQLIEKRSIAWVLIVAITTALTATLQLSGIARRSFREQSRS